jgi:hypothetical protein
VQPSSITGTVDVTSKRSFTISGYVNTSHGTVTTKVAQTVSFFNYQYYDLTDTVYAENINQGTTVSSNTMVSQPGVASTVYNQEYSFPFVVDYSDVYLSNGNITQKTTAKQTYQLTTSTTQAGKVTYSSTLVNAGQHADTLFLNSSFQITGNTAQSAAQQYNYFDSTGVAYDCDIAAAANLLTSFSTGCAQ